MKFNLKTKLHTPPFINCKTVFLITVLFFCLSFFSEIRAAGFSGEIKGLNFCDEIVPLKMTEVYENLDQELLLLSEAKSRIWLTFRRSGRYLPGIEKALNDAQLPLDLKYLPLALTGLDPTFRQGNRRGLWRLSEAEAGALGLSIRKDIDERLDPVTSTAAVMQRFKNLKSSYGNWTMATAAFLDETGVTKAISEAGGEKNFYNLYLPENIEKNMNTILAGKLIFSNPDAYGYHLGRVWPILANKRYKLDTAADIKTLAAENKIDYKTFRDMNPHLLEETAPVGAWIYIP